MKILPLLVPASILFVSCQPITPTQPTLPPVVKSTPVVTNPTKKYLPRKPKVEVEAETPDPRIPDPVKPMVTEIPRFKVPENVQPKVSDGINQGEFIELKW